MGKLIAGLLIALTAFGQYVAPSPVACTGASCTFPAGSNVTMPATLLTGEITPTALSGSVNDYDPTGCSAATSIRIDGGAADRNITGLACGTPSAGRIVQIVNVGTTNSIVLVNQSASSTSTNRFLLPADTALPINTAMMLRYDGTSGRWRPWSRALADTGVTAGTYTSMTVDRSGRVTAGTTATAFQSSAVATNIAAADIIASAASTRMYHIDWTVSLTSAGTSCTSATTVILNAVLTDPNTSSPVTVPLATIALGTSAGYNGTVGFIASGSEGLYVKTGTALQYSTTSYTAGASCSPAPSYQVTGQVF